MAFVVAANPAHAQLNDTTYMSAAGGASNSPGCGATPATACGRFESAINTTVAGGRVVCVNAATDNTEVTITKSITIDCPSGESLGAITVNGPGIVVRLRNLTINGENIVQFGINAVNMAALYLENCVIINNNNASGVGGAPPFLSIKFVPSSNAQLFVTNTIISNNGDSGAGGGISIAPTGGATASVTLDGVKLLGNVFGIGLNSSGGTIVGAMHHSTVSGSNVSGLVAFGGGSPIFWNVDDSKIMNNHSFGIQALGSGVNLEIGNSTISGNGTGVSGSGIVSFKNNQISNNATDGTPLPAVPAGLQ